VTLPVSWSPDGLSIVYEVTDPKTQNDLWVLPLSRDRKAIPLLQTPFRETHGQISPDGKWLAYSSNEAGRNEVYVQPFPAGVGKWQVSTNGGVFPRWRRDGRELFVMCETVRTSPVVVPDETGWKVRALLHRAATTSRYSRRAHHAAPRAHTDRLTAPLSDTRIRQLTR